MVEFATENWNERLIYACDFILEVERGTSTLTLTPTQLYSSSSLMSLVQDLHVSTSRTSIKCYPLYYSLGSVRDQARDLNEGEVFLILGRSFCPFFSFPYIFYTLKLLFQLKTGRSLILPRDYLSLVSL